MGPASDRAGGGGRFAPEAERPARQHRLRSGRGRQKQRSEAEQRALEGRRPTPGPLSGGAPPPGGEGGIATAAGLWGSPEKALEWEARERALEALVSRVQGNALLDVSNDGRKPARLSPLRPPVSPGPPSFEGADGQIDGRALVFGRLKPLMGKSVLRVVPTDSAAGASAP